MLDLRKPAGFFFAALGIILIVTAIAAPQFTAPMLDVNLNLYFGIFSVLFGGVFLLLARRA
jgi:ABC-type transport system involved in multi-copper enzyme maturation permease subunit